MFFYLSLVADTYRARFIGGDSLKKILPILLSIIILGASLFVQVEKASAFAPVVARIAAGSAGERVVLGLMEKTGLNIATKEARKKAMERFEYEAMENLKFYQSNGDTVKYDELANFYNQLANLSDTQLVPTKQKTDWVPGDYIEIPEKPGFGKYILTGAMFLTGADLVYDIYQSIKTAYDEQTELERLVDIQEGLKTGDVFTSVYGNGFLYNGQYVFIGTKTNYEQILNNIDINKPHYGVFNEITYDYGNKFRVEYSFYYTEIGSSSQRSKNAISDILTKVDNTEKNQVQSIPTSNDVPVKTDLPWLEQYKTYGTVPSDLPSTIDVDFPTNDDYADPGTDSWNQPISDFNAGPGTGSDTGTDPDAGTDDWTSSPTKKIDWTKLKLSSSALTEVFPFSIPWDLFRLLSIFDVEPIPPKFIIDTSEPIDLSVYEIDVKYKFDIDFAVFDWVARIGRWFLIIVFDIAVILGLRRLLPE